MQDQRAGAKAPAAPQPVVVPPEQARSAGPGPSAAAHQSAELLTSMGLPTSDPGVTDPVAAQSDDVRGAYPTETDGETADAAAPDDAANAAAPGPGPGVYTPHEAARGDALEDIARAHYGTANLFRAIREANPYVVDSDGRTLAGNRTLQIPDLDTIIATCNHRPTVKLAFGRYWEVDVDREADAERIPVATFRRVHAQLKLLPPEDTRGTWTALLHAADEDGGSLGWDGTFSLGDEAIDTEHQRYGRFGTRLTADAPLGATSIDVGTAEGFEVGSTTAIGEGATRESVTIEGHEPGIIRFGPPLANAHPAGTALRPESRDVRWLEAVTRHEIGHAVDLTQVDTRPLTKGLARWIETWSIEQWLAPLGESAWQTADGEHVVGDERDVLIEVIYRVAEQDASALTHGPGPDGTPAFERYASRGLPALEAVMPMARRGERYFVDSSDHYRAGGLVYVPAPRGGNFYRYDESVTDNQVRQFQLYSPAEFFAELYTVYYEEAGDPSAEPGRLIPVSSWKAWMDDNVAARNRDPATVTEEGAPSPVRGMPAGE